jgi:hypothetical protein
VQAFALVELGDNEAIDVFLRREDAYDALNEVLADEPQWVSLLYVAPIELDERELSLN